MPVPKMDSQGPQLEVVSWSAVMSPTPDALLALVVIMRKLTTEIGADHTRSGRQCTK